MLKALFMIHVIQYDMLTKLRKGMWDQNVIHVMP